MMFRISIALLSKTTIIFFLSMFPTNALRVSSRTKQGNLTVRTNPLDSPMSSSESEEETANRCVNSSTVQSQGQSQSHLSESPEGPESPPEAPQTPSSSSLSNSTIVTWRWCHCCSRRKNNRPVKNQKKKRFRKPSTKILNSARVAPAPLAAPIGSFGIPVAVDSNDIIIASTTVSDSQESIKKDIVNIEKFEKELSLETTASTTDIVSETTQTILITNSGRIVKQVCGLANPVVETVYYEYYQGPPSPPVEPTGKLDDNDSSSSGLSSDSSLDTAMGPIKPTISSPPQSQSQ